MSDEHRTDDLPCNQEPRAEQLPGSVQPLAPLPEGIAAREPYMTEPASGPGLHPLPPGVTQASATPLTPVPGYEILTELGRGGIGNVLFRDDVVIFRTLTENTAEARRFFMQLKEALNADLRQEEVLIVERQARIL
jgi:hypothetical protein